MSGTDWLRNLAKRRRKPATGGIVTAEQAKAAVSNGCLMPAPRPVPNGLVLSNATIQFGDGEPVPVASVEIETRPADRIDPATAAQRMQDALNRYTVQPMLCPCVAIYSHCYCYLRKRTAR